MQFFRGFLGGLLIAACLALGVFGAAAPAFAQASSPAIVVEGNRRVDPDVVRSYFKGVDQASVDQGVKDLSASGLFTNVSARIVRGKVIVKVVESDILLNRIAFEGNSKIKSDQLAVEVQSKAHAGYNEAVAQGDIERIKEVYRRTGRSDAKVTKRLVQLPNGRYDLVFTIDEGSKTGVKAINFVGNAHFSAYRLHGLMATTEMNFLSFIKTSDVYDADRLASDEEAIRKYYMRNGFADFRIANTDVHYDSSEGGYIITITLDEGPQYHVSSVRIDSHIANVNGDALLKFVKLSPGDVYDATASAWRTRQWRPHDRAGLHSRRRTKSLCRAYRDHRQHAHARLRDSPRVRYRRRRSL
jgi:outer membrane protein insertion porin family